MLYASFRILVFFGVNNFNFNDKLDCVTDGYHDGSIDFIYFDEEDYMSGKKPYKE